MRGPQQGVQLPPGQGGLSESKGVAAQQGEGVTGLKGDGRGVLTELRANRSHFSH